MVFSPRSLKLRERFARPEDGFDSANSKDSFLYGRPSVAAPRFVNPNGIRRDGTRRAARTGLAYNEQLTELCKRVEAARLMKMNEERIGIKANGKLDDEVDSLFKLPLSEFTDARNNLAAQLKRDGRADDASFVKALAKPSISAWAVNQLHWNHRAAFDRLIAAGQRIRQAQTSHTTSKEMRESLDARGEALSHLSDL